MFGKNSTVDDDVDTLSEYPVIIPFGTKGGFHVIVSVIIILLIFPGTKKNNEMCTTMKNAHHLVEWSQ